MGLKCSPFLNHRIFAGIENRPIGAVNASCSISSTSANARRTIPSCFGSTSIVTLVPI